MSVAIAQRPESLTMSGTCRVLGLNRSSVLQRRAGLVGCDSEKRSRKQTSQPRALTATEREAVRQLFRSEPYLNQPPAQIYQCLLEQGKAPCSMSTMHRILREKGENGRESEGLQFRFTPPTCS